jgi:anti-sigma B factor antagonist
MRGLRIDEHREDGKVVLRLEGELDLVTADRVQARLDEAAGSRSAVLVDLSGVEFLDSTGLRLLVSADLRAKQEGWRLLLRRGPSHVHRVFEIALLEERLTFVPDGDGEGQGM